MTALDALTRDDSWGGVRAVVLGFGSSGFAAADNLTHLGATVVVLGEAGADATTDRAERAELLGVLGADVRLDADPGTGLPEGTDLVVTTPDWPVDAPLLAAARADGVAVWGEVELAWRLRHHTTPWLCVGAGDGSVAPVEVAGLLDRILRAAGLRSTVAGVGGLPVVEAVMDPTAYDVLAVPLSASQLRDVTSLRAESAAVLDVPGDDAAAAAHLGRAYEHNRVACVYAVAEPATEELVREADVVEGARAIGVTLGMPSVGMLGLVDDLLVDRAFIEERATSAAELCTVGDLLSSEPAHLRHALVAAALARAHGVSRTAVRDGLRDTPRISD